MKVYWKGKLLGSTPGTFELGLGRQTLRLANPDLGIEREVAVTVVADRAASAEAVFATASLEVRVSPWAEVKVDGRHVGSTPLPWMQVYEGKHVIELTNPDLNQTRRVTVELKAGERRTVRESFE